jgi:hypothetical protein
MEGTKLDVGRLPSVTDQHKESGSSLPQRGPEHLPDGKIDRIVQRTKTLTEDISEWVDLKLKLTQFEIEERVNRELNHVVGRMMVGGLLFLAVVMFLVAAAIGLGEVTGHIAWGFLIVGGLVVIVAALFRFSTPDVVRVNLTDEADEKKAGKEVR